MKGNISYLHGVKRATGALGVELDTNNVFTGFGSRLDTFNGGIIAVDEERLPAGGEGLLQLERVLMVLANQN